MKKAVFLDLDGTINVEKEYTYRIEDFHHLNNWMLSDLKKKGIEISGVYYCLHHPEGKIRNYTIKCVCRKSETGLFWQAQKECQIEIKDSYAIGDKVRDLSICNESDVQGILLDETTCGISHINLDNSEKMIWKCCSLLEAAKLIAKEDKIKVRKNVLQ